MDTVSSSKEIKFYVSKIITGGTIFISMGLISFLSITFFFIDYSNKETIFTTLVLAVSALLICFISLIWGIHMLFFRSLLLTINSNGLTLPKMDVIPWKEIKDFYIPRSFWNFDQEASLVKIVLKDNTVHNLNASLLFPIRPRDLLQILKSYHAYFLKK